MNADEQANQRTYDRSREKRFESVARRRDLERNDAVSYLLSEHPQHLTRCLFVLDGLPCCSRTYDPGPISPEEEAFYEGTPIGALYGLAGSERFAADLAGWTIRFQGDDAGGGYDA